LWGQQSISDNFSGIQEISQSLLVAALRQNFLRPSIKKWLSKVKGGRP
jgi:hypothetical protein